MLWGAVNTFTEHRGSHWSHKDLQHTSLGVLWWSGGALGIWSSRKGHRSMVPALLIILTGWAMSAHSQATETSTKVHTTFGATLALAGIARLIEIASMDPTSLRGPQNLLPLQHIPSLFLVAAGLLFMSATDEELQYIDDVGLDHVTYTLMLFSAAFLIYTFVAVLVFLYMHTGRNATEVKSHQSPGHAYEPLEVEGNVVNSMAMVECDRHLVDRDDDSEDSK